MKHKKKVILILLILIGTISFLMAKDYDQPWGKHLSQIEQEALNEKIIGIVQIAENQLVLVQDSTNVVFNLVIPENMEPEIEKIEIGKRYIFTGKNGKNGFIVEKYIIAEIPDDEEEYE
ncbi:MAG: hypothetical protein WC155_10680 [Candidatus Cloacimonadales bacterium]